MLRTYPDWRAAMARVLIVDDSPTDKLAIYSMLKKYGHNLSLIHI